MVPVYPDPAMEAFYDEAEIAKILANFIRKSGIQPLTQASLLQSVGFWRVTLLGGKIAWVLGTSPDGYSRPVNRWQSPKLLR